MEKMSLKRLAEAIGAKCKGDADITGVCIDTRKLIEGDLFIAIKGERVDGHDLIEEAFKKGAHAVVSSREIEGHDEVIVVSDTIKALMQLAKYYRSLFCVFTVGVTGSVGKTSTKEMIYAVLQYSQKTLKTTGNANNEIGLPLTVFSLNSSYKNAVFEMGMSNFGEIRELAKVCKPSLAVITNIGISHIENLGSRENILKAKMEIAEEMAHDAPLILNSDDDLLRGVSANSEHPVIYYGIEHDADVTADNIVQNGNQTAFTIHFYGKSINATIPTIGRHNVYNALAGFCVGMVVDMKPADIVAALTLYHNFGMRQNITDVEGITVIEDCYNASPQSMKAALDVIKNVQCTGKRVCVFGDMLELGEVSETAHLEVGKEVARMNIDTLFCYGQKSKAIKRGAMMVGIKDVRHFLKKEELAQTLAQILTSGDAVIFKASRGVQMEEVIEEFKKLSAKK